VLSAFALPLDIALGLVEKHFYKNAPVTRLPMIFVTGPARSGTSLVAQTLIRHLPVSYFNNLTAVFQRAPIAANILFRKMICQKKVNYKSYYGKTVSFSGPNDGLHIWDRWTGKDRTSIPGSLGEKERNDMLIFFGAYEKAFRKPFVNKNNNLSTFASLIADALENAHFIYIKRDPLYLAQSLLKARIEIQGDVHVPYGIHSPTWTNKNVGDLDFVQDVCEQVLFHEEITKKQQRKVGYQRFWVESYEEFCDSPERLVVRVAAKILGQPIEVEALRKELKPFNCANTLKIDKNLFQRIQDIFDKIRKENNLLNS